MKKKLLLMGLVAMLCLSLALTGCGNGTPAEPDGDEDEYKVALVLSGPSNDGGWNATGFRGATEAQAMHGFHLSVSENVDQSDIEDVYRGYAMDGYDMVIGHGFQFGDASLLIGPDYPDTYFLVTSSLAHVQEPNVGSAQPNYPQSGFMVGYVAGHMTESKVVGAISGVDMPPVRAQSDYFLVGAKYFDENIRTLRVFTGSFDDVGAVKETATAMIDDGADVILANANQASAGGAIAAQEAGVYYIGINADQHNLAPGTVVTSSVQHWVVIFEHLTGLGMSGELTAGAYEVGIAEGAIELAPFREFEDVIPDDVKADIMDMYEKLKNHEVVPTDYAHLLD